MTHETDTFLLQVTTMRERLACLKTAAMGLVARDVLIAQINKVDLELAELEMAARQSLHQFNGDHRNGDVPYAASQPNGDSWIEPAGSERLRTTELRMRAPRASRTGGVSRRSSKSARAQQPCA